MIKFTEKQFKYLLEAVDAAYVGRWCIGKDYFLALEVFIPVLKRAQDLGLTVREYLQTMNVKDKDYPF